jgi:hypothetical protein
MLALQEGKEMASARRRKPSMRLLTIVVITSIVLVSNREVDHD